MSNALAIASVTAVLKRLLENALIGDSLSSIVDGTVTVDALAPDRIKTGEEETAQLNLFLYHVTPNPGWRNVGLPSRDGNGERLTNPPLALDLHYLLTAYERQDFEAEILLGVAMQTLHETPVLVRDAIRQVLGTAAGALATSGLAEQVEQIKITPQPMGTEEISKLWTAFQAHYRPSAAYHVSVVLIESQGPARSPLPVLTRGEPDPATGRDEGIISQPDLVPPFPTLQEVTPPNKEPAVRMGEVLTFSGHHLDGDEVAAHFTRAGSSRVLELPASSGKTSTEFQVRIPNPAFSRATVRVVRNARLLVVPGGSDPATKVEFANAGNDPTAERLLLTAGASTLKATLSGEHQDDPDVPASPQVAVTIDGRTRTAPLNFRREGVALPDKVPLDTIARVLERAIRGVPRPTEVFGDAIVRVVDGRLLVLPGGDDQDTQVEFANAGNDPTAERLLLTTEANTLKATLSGRHQTDPNIPASPQVDVTVGDATHTVAINFPQGVPGRVPLTEIAPVLQSAIRVAASDDPASDPALADSPQNPDNWQVGIYSVAGVIRRTDPAEPPERTTNELPVALAPRIDAITSSTTANTVTLTVKCSPKVLKTQRVTLVVGDRELVAEPLTRERTDTLVFKSSELPSGPQWVRLRVDRVESRLVDRSGSLPTFDTSQRVTI